MSSAPKMTRCEDVSPLLVFYTCDEVTAEEREQIAAHLANCKECGEQLAEEGALQDAVGKVPQAADRLDGSGVLLSQCRSELAEALDELSAPKVDQGWQPFGLVRKWMALRPAWSAAALLLVGAVVGTQAIQWMPFSTGGPTGTAVNVLAASKFTDEQMSKMSVSEVNFSRPTGKVQVQLQAEQPFLLTSDEDDADVRRVLTYIISNSDRFDAGVRLDCVEALRVAAVDEQVRGALLWAARRDQNPAVRMKSLDALRDLTSDPKVRDTLLDTLKHDSNPGVRVEAVNLLVRSLETGDAGQEVLPELPISEDGGDGTAPEAGPAPGKASVQRILLALQDVQQHDSNRYVRLRSAAALRQINLQDLQ